MPSHFIGIIWRRDMARGAPDGVGGCIKRTADNIVARGIDIPDLNTLMEQLKINCKGIKMFQVSEKEIDEINFE